MNTQKQTVRKSLWVAALAAVFTVSCDKDDVKQPSTGIKLVQRVQESANNFTSFDYNAAGLATRLNTKEDGDEQIVTVEYDANHKATTGMLNNTPLKFVYAGNLLDTIHYIPGNQQGDIPLSYLKLSYQNNRVSSMVNYLKVEGQDDHPFLKNTYEYLGGDVKTQTSYVWDVFADEFVQNEKYVYEYDNKINPLQSLGVLSITFFQVQSEHNPVKKITYDHDNNVVETVTYTYTYDSDGYPTSITEKTVTPGDPAGTTIQRTVTYKP